MSDISTQAAEWVMRLTDEESPPTNADKREFEIWQQADDRHREAVASLQNMLSTLQDAPSNASKQAINTGLSYSETTSWQSLAKALSLVLFIIFPVYVFNATQTTQTLLADKKTNHAEWHTWQLEDASTLHLSGNSAVDIDFTDSARAIRLYKGALIIDVAPDSSRPLNVETRHGNFTALGTRYIVKNIGDSSVLTVLESEVLVTSDEFVESVTLNAGEQVVITEQGLGDIQQVNISRTEQNWHNGLYLVNSLPLSQVLQELDHYHQGAFYFDEQALDGIEVMAVLPLNDPERALTLLSESLPITVEQYTPWIVTVELSQK